MTGQLGNGPNLILHLEAYKFDSSASKVPNSLDLTLSGGVKASDTIALPNGSINWSTCKTAAAYCPHKFDTKRAKCLISIETASKFPLQQAQLRIRHGLSDVHRRQQVGLLAVNVGDA